MQLFYILATMFVSLGLTMHINTLEQALKLTLIKECGHEAKNLKFDMAKIVSELLPRN